MYYETGHVEGAIASIANEELVFGVGLVALDTYFALVAQVLEPLDQLFIERRVAAFGMERTHAISAHQHILLATTLLAKLPVANILVLQVLLLNLLLLIHLVIRVRYYLSTLLFLLLLCLILTLLRDQLRVIRLSTTTANIQYLLILRILYIVYLLFYILQTNVAFTLLFIFIIILYLHFLAR